MITDIPKPDDFFISGWRFLDYGWTQAIDLLIDLQIPEDDYQPDSTDIEEFWELGRPKLITSLVIAERMYCRSQSISSDFRTTKLG
jgi:hypothetical protein